MRFGRSALVLALFLALAGCSQHRSPRLVPAAEPEGAGSVASSIDRPVPEELEPAHIFEIDGNPVNVAMGTFAVPAGTHLLRVWPQGPAQALVPDTVAIDRDRIEVEPLRLEVRTGYRYILAAERTRSREVVEVVTPDGAQTSYGEWKVTIRPVVVQEVPPPDVATVVTGLSGMFAPFLLGPLVGPALF